MTKELSGSTPGPEAEEAERKFKTYILEYRERAAKNAAKVQKEVRIIMSCALEFLMTKHMYLGVCFFLTEDGA